MTASATMATKAVLVAMAGAYSALVAFNNLTDYRSNFEFVRHVLMMDTTFPGNRGMWRAIDSPLAHHACYSLIIATEIVIALLGFLGAARLWRARHDPAMFSRAKPAALWALALGMLLWFGGFVAVGGEWFLMWQSTTWNGTESAFRIAVVFGIVLLYLSRSEGVGRDAP